MLFLRASSPSGKSGSLAALRREITPIAGVRETLERLQIPLCVASSGSHVRMRITLGATGLLPHFRARIFSFSDVTRGKPFPDLYLHAARTLAVPPGRCAVVEDTVVGVTAAVAAGMTVFGFARDGHSNPVDLKRAGALVFSDMLDLPRLLQGE
ncbi:MAG: HAD-IA family hydrolase [Candidatus Binatia bacterium]